MRKRRLLEERWLVDARTDGSAVGPPREESGKAAAGGQEALEEARRVWLGTRWELPVPSKWNWS